MEGACPAPGAATVRGRRRPASVESPTSRPKRGRYTSGACEDCKKRKLKCNPLDGNAGCKRCADNGQPCVYTRGPPIRTQNRAVSPPSQLVEALNNEVSQLRDEVKELADAVDSLKAYRHAPQGEQPTSSPSCHGATLVPSPASSQRTQAPKEPQFVGPTRSAFGIIIAKRSLTRMGFPDCDSLPPSGAQSPTNGPKEANTPQNLGHLLSGFTACEVTRLVNVWREEVEPIYPCVDMGEKISDAQYVLDCMRAGRLIYRGARRPARTAVTARDVDFVKVAMATSLALESHGANELSTAIIDSVERVASRISCLDVDLGKVQLLAMLSIYYFHVDEELLAWRTIGVAARAALEMGLHLKDTLFDNFGDEESRNLATRVFWCVFILDRRWSFGTSLSFALIDRDIDPELPEPDERFPYVGCMVGYARLSSKLWDAIPSFQSSPQQISENIVADLDLSALEWLESIPPHLRLRHPRLGLAPPSQPPVLHRLRALLYLRGNHLRCLIHRHYLLSLASIAGNMPKASLVVEIARDSIQVLVHLNATTDIYSRQQNAFNYFLLSSLAIIFLAVCHAPEAFSGPCRNSFVEGIELVRSLSHRSVVSRRLWESIRGLQPRLKRLERQRSERVHDSNLATGVSSAAPINSTPRQSMGVGGAIGHEDQVEENEEARVRAMDMDYMLSDTDVSGFIPGTSQIGDNLLYLFDAFGQAHQQVPADLPPYPYNADELGVMDGMGDEVSRWFQRLI